MSNILYTNASYTYLYPDHVRLHWQEWDGSTLTNQYQTYCSKSEKHQFHAKWKEIIGSGKYEQHIDYKKYPKISQ